MIPKDLEPAIVMMNQFLIREEQTMKRILTFAVLAALIVTSCQKEQKTEENNFGVQRLFTATTESPATKTALNKNGETYNVLWQNGDQIAIVDAASNIGVYQTTSTTTQGNFSYMSGTAATTPDYKAWYPVTLYNDGAPTLPATQKYIAGNIKNSPMYAESGTESLSFKNICGIIRLNISTSVVGKKVRKIILSANQGMSGTITNAATLASDSYIADVSGTDGITLDCGESGVDISATPTAFHFAVPAETYTGLKITVITTDGLFQTRALKSDKSIVVGRSNIADVTIPFNKLDDVTDLSASGTANTYIVSAAGKYKFKATVKGNGGTDPLTGTTATTIDPAGIADVKVLWELGDTYGKAIKYVSGAYDISYADGYVYFSTPDTFQYGNAYVAIYNTSGTILWSWLIWVGEKPGTVTAGSLTFMDRNLGAIDRDNYMRGFLYVWGRKDPFPAADGGYSAYPYVPARMTCHSIIGPAQSVSYTIEHPTTYIYNGGPWMIQEDYNKGLWRDGEKTIYDPCPVGWRIPTSGNMATFHENIGLRTLPGTGFLGDSSSGDFGYGNPSTGYYTSSTSTGWRVAIASDNGKRLNQSWQTYSGYAIRPVKE